MIRVVLAATDAGIRDIVTVHDCFGCLAGDAAQLNRIIRQELYLMYKYQDWLGRLRNSNGITHPLPDFGDLELEEVLDAEYAFA